MDASALAVNVTEQTKNGSNNSGSGKKKEYVKKADRYCNFCRKAGHMEDACFKKHGYPDWFQEYKNKKPQNPVLAMSGGESDSKSQNLESSQFSQMIQMEIKKYLKKRVLLKKVLSMLRTLLTLQDRLNKEVVAEGKLEKNLYVLNKSCNVKSESVVLHNVDRCNNSQLSDKHSVVDLQDNTDRSIPPVFVDEDDSELVVEVPVKGTNNTSSTSVIIPVEGTSNVSGGESSSVPCISSSTSDVAPISDAQSSVETAEKGSCNDVSGVQIGPGTGLEAGSKVGEKNDHTPAILLSDELAEPSTEMTNSNPSISSHFINPSQAFEHLVDFASTCDAGKSVSCEHVGPVAKLDQHELDPILGKVGLPAEANANHRINGEWTIHSLVRNSKTRGEAVASGGLASSMASANESIPTPSDASSSLFLPTVTYSFFATISVCLDSWWLVKAEKDFDGKLLAVAGFTSRERGAKRVFVSAPIIKRHDLTTLETADGIYLIILGFINELRTKENGFPSEVFNRFLFGFPPDWDSYAANCFKQVTTGIDSVSIPISNGEEAKSPVTPIQSQGEVNELSEQFLVDSASRKSSTLSANTESQSNTKKRLLARPRMTKPERNTTKSVSSDPKRKLMKSTSADPKRKMTKSISSGHKERKTKSISADPADESLSVRRCNNNFETPEKLSRVSSDSMNFKRSRSGRPLLPPLEFWRNQMPVYDADMFSPLDGIKGVTEAALGRSCFQESAGIAVSVIMYCGTRSDVK
ncbi:kinetochore-associated protein KNL-2-like protein isoform X2 [Senna tora]|uniref:Kinetochore-associated protein KNL-2-like protein isoform X2 n=1 Tax=Senna tora TaxID=362788 RepID=A0A834SXF4_9FABA|nr:kinetochore-associated protein KNL-2-like protein isoform X2 [Senna tora]